MLPHWQRPNGPFPFLFFLSSKEGHFQPVMAVSSPPFSSSPGIEGRREDTHTGPYITKKTGSFSEVEKSLYGFSLCSFVPLSIISPPGLVVALWSQNKQFNFLEE